MSHPTDGKYIIDAVSGEKTLHLVGSKFERLYFKILDVSLSAYDSVTGTGQTYFFSSPEAYEVERHIKLAESKKIAWRKKQVGVCKL